MKKSVFDYAIDEVLVAMETAREYDEWETYDIDEKADAVRECIEGEIYYSIAEEKFNNIIEFNVFDAIEYIQGEYGDDYKIYDYCMLYNHLMELVINNYAIIEDAIDIDNNGGELESLYDNVNYSIY